MKAVDGELPARLKKSSNEIRALSVMMKERGYPKVAASCEEAARLLALMWAMLTDERPLTNWDVIDTQLHRLLAAGDVPTVEEAQKIMAVQKMLREVSGE